MSSLDSLSELDRDEISFSFVHDSSERSMFHEPWILSWSYLLASTMQMSTIWSEGSWKISSSDASRFTSLLEFIILVENYRKMMLKDSITFIGFISFLWSRSSSPWMPFKRIKWRKMYSLISFKDEKLAAYLQVGRCDVSYVRRHKSQDQKHNEKANG